MNGGDDDAFVTKGLVCRNISFPDISIPCGKATFIVGESGTGKTTLLKLFNQTETQTSGTILFFGSDISGIKNTKEIRKKAVLCGQNVFLFGGTVKENFDEFRRYVNLPPLPDDEMMRFLNICRAEKDIEKVCKNLSGGEKERVFLSIYLSFRPSVLMLDEPTSALDRETALGVMNSIKEYCAGNGITLIAVSHDRNVIDAVADMIVDLGGKKNG
ncbi:MAG: energy-coupling factor ABC transporter ATP-binding protein [Methanomassiliicoccaceae archaeon]|nr:energy-coupling factor ABC transporter ATP-binding protein [Methanomassiliicoccaceae archaeon]